MSQTSSPSKSVVSRLGGSGSPKILGSLPQIYLQVLPGGALDASWWTEMGNPPNLLPEANGSVGLLGGPAL